MTHHALAHNPSYFNLRACLFSFSFRTLCRVPTLSTNSRKSRPLSPRELHSHTYRGHRHGREFHGANFSTTPVTPGGTRQAPCMCWPRARVRAVCVLCAGALVVSMSFSGPHMLYTACSSNRSCSQPVTRLLPLRHPQRLPLRRPVLSLSSTSRRISAFRCMLVCDPIYRIDRVIVWCATLTNMPRSPPYSLLTARRQRFFAHSMLYDCQRKRTARPLCLALGASTPAEVGHVVSVAHTFCGVVCERVRLFVIFIFVFFLK